MAEILAGVLVGLICLGVVMMWIAAKIYAHGQRRRTRWRAPEERE